KHRGNDITECQEGHRRRYDKKSYAPQTLIQPTAENFGNFLSAADSSRHRWQFCGRYRHAKQADRKRVQTLRVSKGHHRTHWQKAGEHSINKGADLHDTATHKHRKEVSDYGSDLFTRDIEHRS